MENSRFKFRAWDEKRKCFEHWGIGDIDGDGAGCKFPSLSQTKLPQMQFTGLLDKNGVEIYEGDILAEDNHYWEVVFLKGQFTIRYINPIKFRIGAVFSEGRLAKYLECGIWHTLDYGDLKVIGNIYENKELLNAK